MELVLWWVAFSDDHLIMPMFVCIEFSAICTEEAVCCQKFRINAFRKERLLVFINPSNSRQCTHTPTHSQHTHTHVHTHTHTHTYAHAHTHTRTEAWFCLYPWLPLVRSWLIGITLRPRLWSKVKAVPDHALHSKRPDFPVRPSFITLYNLWFICFRMSLHWMFQTKSCAVIFSLTEIGKVEVKLFFSINKNKNEK